MPASGATAIGSDGTVYVSGVTRSQANEPLWCEEGSSLPGGPPKTYGQSRSGEAGVEAIAPNGTVKWVSGLDDSFLSAPTVGSDGTVYVAGQYRTLYALDANGKIDWVFDAQGYRESLPGCPSENPLPALGPDGTVYVVSWGKLHALTPKGTKRWSYGPNCLGAPVVARDGTVYVGQGQVHAVESSGKLRWKFDLDSSPAESLAIGTDGTIYVATYAGSLFAISPKGKQRWRFRVGGAYWQASCSDVICASNAVFCTTGDGRVIALTPSGKKLWRMQLSSDYSATQSLSIGPGNVLYANSGSFLCAIVDR